jgi:S-adenosylmethionine synthetase
MDLTIDTVVPDSAARSVEVVERKGLGHPDTLCDAIAERVSLRLSQQYVQRFGTLLHHNVDKVLLCGGASHAAFGGGVLLQPIEVFLGGRATEEWRGVKLPIHEIATAACRDVLRERVPELDVERDVRIVSRLRAGSTDLTRLFAKGRSIALANDTSCGVGFAPWTALERIVREVERAINAAETKRDHPALGSDVKVMGLRRQDRLRLVIACAMIGRHLSGLEAYVEATHVVHALATRVARDITASSVEVYVNAADDLAAGDLFLTVVGTSAEAGDDGEVGRGNRSNGLITPHRPMTMEAAAGKNPVSHVGKLYNVAANRIARDLADELPAVGAEVSLVSRIGAPIDDPELAYARLTGTPRLASGPLQARVREIVHNRLSQLPALRDEFLAQLIDVY